MNEWLEGAARRVGGGVSVDDDEAKALLELARVAAHGSGDRTNAPLVCYLVGLARGRGADAGVDDLARRAAG